MAKRYQHITEPVRRDVAERVGGLLWQVPDSAGKPDDGAAEAPAAA